MFIISLLEIITNLCIFLGKLWSTPTAIAYLSDYILVFLPDDSPKSDWNLLFLHNRLHTYNLQPGEYRQEENTIHNILYNSFPVQLHKPHLPRPQKQQQTTHTQMQKWAIFTYIGKETTYITNFSDAST